MKALKGYKVVSVYGKERWSWSPRGFSALVQYRKGAWTQPFKSYGPLAVFETRADARVFLKRMGRCLRKNEIWRCTYRPSTRRALRCKGSRCELRWLPSGTILAEAVKLTRRVA